MKPDTPTTDRPARIAVAKFAPFAFLVVMAAFIGIVIASLLRDGRTDWPAAVLAIAMVPAIVVTWVNRETVCDLVAENDDLKRDLRSVGRLSL